MIKKASKKVALIGSFALSPLALQSQQAADHFKKDTLHKTEISILYNHYEQDGDHSAVTGGSGTEKLSVYAPSVHLKRTNKKQQTWAFNAGADVITSASTDNINFEVSSASRIDTRAYVDVDYAHQLRNKELSISYGTGISVESDYLSVPLRMGLAFPGKNKMRNYFLDISMFFDDLRWGRFDEDYYRPAKLVYPKELRTTEWHEQYLRQSYNIKIGFTQVINKRLIFGVFPALVYQNGLLSTPFHRVYFSDGTLKVENLPGRRSKLLLGLKANAFLGGSTVIKNAIDFYQDDFGVTGLALETETAVKMKPEWTLAPFTRFYVQQGAKYFAPKDEHSIDEVYYTSDYDLSDFKSYKIGLSLRYAPFHYFSKKLAFHDTQFRYAYYHRSDGLRAHIIGLVFNGAFFTKKKK